MIIREILYDMVRFQAIKLKMFQQIIGEDSTLDDNNPELFSYPAEEKCVALLPTFANLDKVQHTQPISKSLFKSLEQTTIVSSGNNVHYGLEHLNEPINSIQIQKKYKSDKKWQILESHSEYEKNCETKTIKTLQGQQQSYFYQKKNNKRHYQKKLERYHNIVDRVLAKIKVKEVLKDIQKAIQNGTLKYGVKIDWHGFRCHGFQTFLDHLSDEIRSMEINKRITYIKVLHIVGKGLHSEYEPVLKRQLQYWCQTELQIKRSLNTETKEYDGSILVIYHL